MEAICSIWNTVEITLCVCCANDAGSIDCNGRVIGGMIFMSNTVKYLTAIMNFLKNNLED